MKTGQINLADEMGKKIYEFSSREDVQNIIEIGTWNGLGSTLCVLQSIVDYSKKKNFISFELMNEMYNEAVRNINELSTSTGVDYMNQVKLVNGTIIDFEDVFWIDHIKIKNCIESGVDDEENGISSAHESLYYDLEMNTLKNSTNFYDTLPERIDLLILDGGGLTTYPEWKKLENRTNIVILDDTRTIKSKKIRQELLNDNEWLNIVDDLQDRCGFSIFERKNKIEQ